MADDKYNVLFLCTGNSARSILAEGLINRWGQGKFRSFSAGSHPTGTVNPRALDMLLRFNIPLENPRSKSWDEFAVPGAPEMDFVFTVCDRAAAEVCPVWPGQPVTANWSVPDPAATQGSDEEIDKAFWKSFQILEARIKLFSCLPIAKLDQVRLQKQVTEIGKSGANELTTS